METVACLPTVAVMRQHVLTILCHNDRLDPGLTPLYQAVIIRKGRPCGLLFEAQGPRLLKTHAVWAGEEHRILFYNSSGERFAIIRLTEAPDPRRLAG